MIHKFWWGGEPEWKEHPENERLHLMASMEWNDECIQPWSQTPKSHRQLECLHVNTSDRRHTLITCIATKPPRAPDSRWITSHWKTTPQSCGDCQKHDHCWLKVMQHCTAVTSSNQNAQATIRRHKASHEATARMKTTFSCRLFF